MKVSTGIKVWVMSFIDTSEVELYSSAEAAYKAAQNYVNLEDEAYRENDLKFLKETYEYSDSNFYVKDLLWVDKQDILTISD